VKVFIQGIPANRYPSQLYTYGLVMLDGYRAGEFVAESFDVDKERLSKWATQTGYEVVDVFK